MNKYYSLLGVSPNATLQQIKKAYRKKVMKYHPDRNKDPKARLIFIEIDEAYDYLCDLRLGRIKPHVYKTTTKSTKETKESKRRKDWQKAQLVKEFVYQSQKLEREANVYYVLICLPSMLILPVLGAYIGIWLNSIFILLLLLFTLPALSIYWFCSKVYDSFTPKRRKLSIKLRKDIKAL